MSWDESTSTSLEQFAMAEGRKGGEFYTPRSVVQLLVAMLKPYQGRVYDPCCGSAGMFIQSRQVHRRPCHRQRQRRKGQEQPIHLQAGIKPNDLAPGQNEPGHPWHRGTGRVR